MNRKKIISRWILRSVGLLSFMIAHPLMAASVSKKKESNTPSELKGATQTTDSMTVMGLVAGRAVTDRQVMIDLCLEFPERYKKDGTKWITQDEMRNGFNRVAIQLMVMEEFRIVGETQVSGKLIESKLSSIRAIMGVKAWKQFENDFQVSESLLRDRVAAKIQVQNAIDERVKLSMAGQLGAVTAAEKQELARKSIEEWFNQLKTRYRLQLFRYSE